MAAVLPPGFVLPPNENRGDVYLGTLVGFLVPSLTIVALRTVVRIVYTKMWWDDYLMLFAVPLLISNNALSIASINNGVGRHLLLIQPEDAMKAFKYNTIAQPLNLWALFFVKASIMTLLLRLKPSKPYRIILWSTLVLLLAITIAVFVITMAQCQPLVKEWNRMIPGKCWPADVFTDAAYILCGCTIFTDLVYILVPIVFLWKVQLKPAVKYGIFGVLGLGVLSMACTIIAIPFINVLSKTTDPTYDTVNLACIKTAELNIAILTGCIPPLQPLFRRIGGIISNASKPESYESRHAFKKPRSEYKTLPYRSSENDSEVPWNHNLNSMGSSVFMQSGRTQFQTVVSSNKIPHLRSHETNSLDENRRIPPTAQKITMTTDMELKYGR